MSLPFTKAISKKLLKPERDENGEPDSFHLMLGEEGYRIQSRVFRIPTRFGAFSRGPRELQAYEGSQFALLIYQIILWFIYGIPLLAFANFVGLLQLDLYITTFHAVLAIMTYYWTGMLFDPRRSDPQFHAVWREAGWKRNDLEDKLRQWRLLEAEIQLSLERNSFNLERLEFARGHLQMQNQIREIIYF
ncbi:hypothetical protein F4805DRAFT_475441 [Annulohypoxylon moriforme]|nr:hypothetical protein F4805DRAFT_475441 [Annulohypoxylon moriforme]